MHFNTISVIPEIPKRIAGLRDIAYDFWFSWNDRALKLFAGIDCELWEGVYHNPVRFLIKVSGQALEKAASNKDYLDLYDQTLQEYSEYMNSGSWFSENFPAHRKIIIAYFSAEFGLHESHPIYSGGLGLLAGDHCKSASDLGVPIVAMGLLYRQGYFSQFLDREGRQEAEYPVQNYHEMPMKPVLGDNGRELKVNVDLPGRRVAIRIWKAKVGKVNLFLLDTDLPENTDNDCSITDQLYGGCRDIRICQEIVLGIGGVKALRAMGIGPDVWHINEGHAAFLCLERIREKVSSGIKPKIAIEAVKANTLFTTHTPVPAGHDIFEPEMIRYYFENYYPQLGMDWEEFSTLGFDRENQSFNMTSLAMNLADYKNGVSKLHAHVSRAMFCSFFGCPREEVPIGYITNGVHTETWMAASMKKVMSEHVGSQWNKRINQPEAWEKVDDIPGELLWKTHMQLKKQLVEFARGRLKLQRIRNYEFGDRLSEIDDFLDPNALIIGFARRFATYKRAALIFSDLDRLASIVNDPLCPVQLVFAGKAHPADKPGQDMIKQVFEISNTESFKGKIVFIENYDINVARHMVRGVDVWLNNPRRPQEASGTSGMKAAMNGAVNFSVSDGWWAEAYNGENGFVIGEEKNYYSDENQDRDDSLSIYKTLEEDIIPVFFDREKDIPVRWIAIMKNSIKTAGQLFNTHRMVMQYTQEYYLQAMQRGSSFREDNFAVAKRLHNLKAFFNQNWYQVMIEDVSGGSIPVRKVGEEITVESVIRLGPFWQGDITAEIVYGDVEEGTLVNLSTIPMEMVERLEEGVYKYRGSFKLPQGTVGYTVRVRPASPDFANNFDLPLVTWAK